MSLALTASITAMAPGLQTQFLGTGGTEPYAYAVLPNGAGGVIDPDTGIYTAPASENADPKKSQDIIQVTDDDGNTASRTILVMGALGLFCEVLQNQLGLNPGRVYFWDQKIMQPTDSDLYIAVSVLTCKPFANTMKTDTSGSGVSADQSINMLATLSLDIMSRSTQALMRKEEVLLALASLYSQSQQQLNSFFIGKLPPGGQFVNLSNPDGAAIPYRFNLSVNIQYFVRKITAVPYFDQFAAADIVSQP